MKNACIAIIGVAWAVAVVPSAAAAQTSDVPPPPPGSTAPPPQQQVVVVEQTTLGPQQYTPMTAEPAPTRSRPRLGLLISGIALFAVSYIVHAALISPFAGWSAFEGYQPEWEEFRVLGAVPLAGPWIQLAIKPTDPFDDSWATYLVIDALLQTAGLTMLILGVTLRTETTARADAGPSLMIAPLAGQNTAGLTAYGRF